MLSKNLYESLPYFYIAIGLLGLFFASPFYGKIAAVFLIWIAVRIYKMRRDYRKAQTNFREAAFVESSRQPTRIQPQFKRRANG